MTVWNSTVARCLAQLQVFRLVMIGLHLTSATLTWGGNDMSRTSRRHSMDVRHWVGPGIHLTVRMLLGTGIARPKGQVNQSR